MKFARKDINLITEKLENKLQSYYENETKTKIRQCNILNENELKLFEEWFNSLKSEEKYNLFDICKRYSFDVICKLIKETFNDLDSILNIERSDN